MAGFPEACIEYLDCPNLHQHLPLLGLVEALWLRLARRVPVLRPTLLVEAEAGFDNRLPTPTKEILARKT